MTAGFLAFIGAVCLTTLGFAWSMNSRLGAANRRIGHLEHTAQAIDRQVHGLTSGLTLLVRALTEMGVLTVDRTIAILTTYDVFWQTEVARESETLDRLTRGELARFEAYRVKLVAQRELLTPDELADYQAIVAKLYNDRPNDQGLWALLGLGLILGGIVAIGAGASKGSGEPG